jgi:NAD(P) transhydrogenase
VIWGRRCWAWGLDDFLRTVFNYPTLAECYKVAALDASNKLRY